MLYQRGSTPQDMRTFALPLRLPSVYCWRGLPVKANTLIVFPNDRELVSTMGADVEMLTISIDQQLVDTTLASWDLNPASVFDTARTTELAPVQYHTLHRNLALIMEFMVKYGDHSQFPHISRDVQEYLLENLLNPALHNLAQAPVSTASAAKRVQSVTDYILANLREPLTVADVCTHVSCSRRSLEQCFQRYVGTSPKQFIQSLRYKHCRQALVTSTPGSKVRDIASQHGFWHMGQFTTTYRRLFGETPGQTLRQSR